MATAKSDTNLKKDKDDVTAISWTESWTVVDPDMPNLHHKAALEVDDSWLVVEPTPTCKEYEGLKKSTFVVEAWHWAFGWLTQKDKDKRKGKKKNEKTPSKGRDAKSSSVDTLSSALEEKILGLFEKTIERAIVEIIEENILRNEEIFQKMLTDVIETAWVELWEEEESKTEKAAEITEAFSNIFDQMLNDTVENACDEVETEDRLDNSCVTITTDDTVDNSGIIEELDQNTLDVMALRETDTEADEETESVLSRHEQTLEKVGMFYDRTSDDKLPADGELIKSARQYVQDIIVVSLGILNEEQNNLKGLSFEKKDIHDYYPTVPETSKSGAPESGMVGLFQNAQVASGGGDFPNNNPRSVFDGANLVAHIVQHPYSTVKPNKDAVDTVFKEKEMKAAGSKTLQIYDVEGVEAVEVEVPLENKTLKDEENVQQANEPAVEEITDTSENRLCEVIDAENPKDGIFEAAVENALKEETTGNGIDSSEKENAGRLRRFRNRLSRLCFWRKEQNQ